MTSPSTRPQRSSLSDSSWCNGCCWPVPMDFRLAETSTLDSSSWRRPCVEQNACAKFVKCTLYASELRSRSVVIPFATLRTFQMCAKRSDSGLLASAEVAVPAVIEMQSKSRTLKALKSVSASLQTLKPIGASPLSCREVTDSPDERRASADNRLSVATPPSPSHGTKCSATL